MLHCIELHCVSCIASVVGDALCGADFTLTAEDIVKIKRGGASNSFSMQCCIYAIMLEGSARLTDNLILRGSTVFLNASIMNNVIMQT